MKRTLDVHAVAITTALALLACGGAPPPAAPGGRELVEAVTRVLADPTAELPTGLVATDDELMAALGHAAMADVAPQRVHQAILDGVVDARLALKQSGASLADATVGRFEMQRSNVDPADIKTYMIHAELRVGAAQHDIALGAVAGARGWALAGPPTLRLEAPAATAARTVLTHGLAALELVAAHRDAPEEAAAALRGYLEANGAAVDAARADLAAALGDAPPEAALDHLGATTAQLGAFAAARDRLKGTPALQDPGVIELLDRFRLARGPR